MPRKTTLQLNVRITDDDRKLFDEIEEKTGVRDSILTHSFIFALKKYWQKHHTIKLPFHLSLDENTEIHEAVMNGTLKTKTTKKK